MAQSTETYAEMVARIEHERRMNPVQDLEVIAQQQRELDEKYWEEFGKDAPLPVTHLYREEGHGSEGEPTDSTRDFAPFLEQPGAVVNEPISQQPQVKPAAVKPTTAKGK